MKKFSSYLRILQWVPVIHRNSIDPVAGTQVQPSGEVSLCVRV